MKTPEGEVKVAVLGVSPGVEEYLQHLNVFLQMLARKKYEDDLVKLAKAVVVATALVRKFSKAPNGEKGPDTAERLKILEAAKTELIRAEASKTAKVGLVYELFHKGLKEDPELQWDRIVDDMHAKDPWEDLKGAKHDGLCRKLSTSLWECIDFHKLTVYSINAAERQRFYMLCNLKKPAMSFNETTLASIILNHLPVAWRIQYALTHTLVPESPRAILLDLENIEKLFAEKSNETARAN
jgi:hypothetical protein